MFILLFLTSIFNHLISTTTLIIATITSVVDMKKRDEGILYPRQETVAPTNIPAYASACSGSVRYSSACSCVGVTAMTTMAPTLTYTQTITTTTYLISAPTYAPLHPTKTAPSHYFSLTTYLDFLSINILLEFLYRTFVLPRRCQRT